MDITIEVTEIIAESTINETVIYCDVVISDAGGSMVDVPIETASANGVPIPIVNKNIDIIIPTKTSDLTNDSDFQTVTDNTLQTEAQTIAAAINEVNSVAKGANQAISFVNYEAVILEAENEWLNICQNIYVDTIDVPDLWIKSVDISFVPYSYISDEQFITDILAGFQIGHYIFALLETQKVDLTNYYNKTETNTALASKANLSGGNDFLNTQNFDGRINHKIGEYFYTAASKTADTVNDTRVINSAGVEIHSICTALGATKGSGTWVVVYVVDHAYKRIGINRTPTSVDLEINGSVHGYGAVYAQRGNNMIAIDNWSANGYKPTLYAQEDIYISPNIAFAFCYKKNGDYSHLSGKYNYEAASTTADTINDTRTSNQSGVKIEEICTLGNTTKGGGTWKGTNAISHIGGNMIKLTNKTGAASVKGTVIYASPTTDLAFTTNPIDGDMPFGIVYDNGIADGSECWVVVSGVAEVLLVNSVASTRSYIAYSSASVAGRIDTAATAPASMLHFREIGHTLESKTAGTNVLCKCVLHFN